jgi:hypothetical protein
MSGGDGGDLGAGVFWVTTKEMKYQYRTAALSTIQMIDNWEAGFGAFRPSRLKVLLLS